MRFLGEGGWGGITWQPSPRGWRGTVSWGWGRTGGRGGYGALYLLSNELRGFHQNLKIIHFLNNFGGALSAVRAQCNYLGVQPY